VLAGWALGIALGFAAIAIGRRVMGRGQQGRPG
jgi:hypothetical protein